MDACAVSIPLKAPIKMAGEEIHSANNLLVRIEDTGGGTGWGEAASAPTMTGETPESMVAAVRYMSPVLEGLEIVATDVIGETIDPLIYANHGAKAAIEIALIDLAGKHLDIPAFDVLGGRQRMNSAMITMVAGTDVSNEIDNVKEQLDAGFTSFKVKVGSNNPDMDLERSASVRRAAGTDIRISADANQGYDRPAALRFAEGANQAGLDFMEQLVRAGDLEGMAACASSTSVPLGADEGLHSLDDIRRHHQTGAANGGSLKTIKFGGMSGVMLAASLMDSLGMHINLAGKVGETSIASAAVAHLTLAVPQLDWDASITNQYLADDIVETPLGIVNGRLYPPDSPGLGIKVNEEQVSRYRVSI